MPQYSILNQKKPKSIDVQEELISKPMANRLNEKPPYSQTLPALNSKLIEKAYHVNVGHESCHFSLLH